MKAACSDDEFIRLFETLGPSATARHLGIIIRNVFARRRSIELKIKRELKSPRGGPPSAPMAIHPGRIQIDVQEGVVIVGSDGHYWGGPASVAHRAFVKFCKDMKPRAVIFNGDAFDGASISRFASGWEKRPTVQEEIEAVQERLHEIELASGKAQRIWTLGNHDQRYERAIATALPQLAKVQGVHLKDHFPQWEPAWSVWINNEVVIKHRWKGGIHATHNNAVGSGKTMITGHLHSLKVTPYSDYSDRPRWGVDCGTLADPYGPQFEYGEDNPVNHRSGFCVLTFKGGKLLWPELVAVHDQEHVDFRGQLVRV